MSPPATGRASRRRRIVGGFHHRAASRSLTQGQSLLLANTGWRRTRPAVVSEFAAYWNRDKAVRCTEDEPLDGFGTRRSGVASASGGLPWFGAICAPSRRGSDVACAVRGRAGLIRSDARSMTGCRQPRRQWSGSEGAACKGRHGLRSIWHLGNPGKTAKKPRPEASGRFRGPGVRSVADSRPRQLLSHGYAAS